MASTVSCTPAPDQFHPARHGRPGLPGRPFPFSLSFSCFRVAGAYARRVIFSKELQDDVRSGAITVSFRLWKRPKVKVGGRYAIGSRDSGGPGGEQIEVDSIELVPFATITEADVAQAGEPDRETLRHRAAHAGPIHDDTLLYRVEFHSV
jgi:hypothetical protein